MRLYNSLTGTLDPVTPVDGTLRMYVCGVTPYDTTHLGHALTYATFDVINRYFQYRGYNVRYIQNVTDIDDDILRKANELGEPWKELGERWTKVHQDSLAALNVLPPEKYTLATEHIASMVEMIESLIARGHAYVAGPNVYFRVRSFAAYGELSDLPYDVMLERLNETGDRTDDSNKEYPLDFVLWLGQKPGEPAWDSPWGLGRPGWHIECSAMAIDQLGPTLDVHGGGADLIFPHHENEIAQSESFTGKHPFTRTWVHNGMLRLGAEKMSKSLGNLVLAQDLLERYSSDAIRLYLHREHYRDSFSFDEDKLEAAQRLADSLAIVAWLPGGSGDALDVEHLRDAFLRALEDDLDMATAIETLRSLAEIITAAHEAHRDTYSAQAELRTLAGILGLRLAAPD
ncbi:MAG TPA: cysteine--tRNA ligase [Chloroflexota bacterium]|nr:cysteine--tRNA ligase [Chloroflexota bacterium]